MFINNYTEKKMKTKKKKEIKNKINDIKSQIIGIEENELSVSNKDKRKFLGLKIIIRGGQLDEINKKFFDVSKQLKKQKKLDSNSNINLDNNNIIKNGGINQKIL